MSETKLERDEGGSFMSGVDDDAFLERIPVEMLPEPARPETMLERMNREDLAALAQRESGPTGSTKSAPSSGTKHDQQKQRWDLLPMRAVEEVVKVLTLGASKYAPDNWRQVDGWRWRYYGAALRHMVAWWRGEKYDPEFKTHHLAHAVCCLLFALELDLFDGDGTKR